MTSIQIFAGVLLGMILLVGACVYMQPMMSECPTAHPGIICPMHDTSALSFWQRAIILSRRVAELVVFAFVVPSAWLVISRARSDPGYQWMYDRLYVPQLPQLQFQELFSQGILHPKIF